MTQDRFALVTGGSTGIGRCLAQLAAEDGHALAATIVGAKKPGLSQYGRTEK